MEFGLQLSLHLQILITKVQISCQYSQDDQHLCGLLTSSLAQGATKDGFSGQVFFILEIIIFCFVVEICFFLFIRNFMTTYIHIQSQ